MRFTFIEYGGFIPTLIPTVALLPKVVFVFSDIAKNTASRVFVDDETVARCPNISYSAPATFIVGVTCVYVVALVS